MDIIRTRRRPGAWGFIAPTIGLIAIGAGAWVAVPLLLHPAPAVPHVARGAIVVDVARVETLVRAVRAPGTLVPDRVVVVATNAEGLVDRVAVRAGAHVDVGTVVAELHNPDLDAAVLDARSQCNAARALLASARESAKATRLDSDGANRSASAEAERAGETSTTYAVLAREGLIGTLQFREAQIKATETRALAEIATRKIGVADAGERAKIAVAQAAVDRADAILSADLARVATLVVRAGSTGIVQSVSVDPGAHVSLGGELARIAGDRDLKAVLTVAEGDMHGVAPGMRVALETSGSGRLGGYVARIAPVAVNGSIAVDVTLDRFANVMRPAQNVDGTIELFHSHSALTIARPVGAADASTIALFRVARDGTTAMRTRVRLGAGSLDRVEVRSGLARGDAVVVSDLTANVTSSSSELRIDPL